MRLTRYLVLMVAAGQFACSAMREARTAEQQTADAAITHRVEAALLSAPNIYAQHIDVDTERGVVWLSGWVYSTDELQGAVRTSARVAGVQRVVNELELMVPFGMRR